MEATGSKIPAEYLSQAVEELIQISESKPTKEEATLARRAVRVKYKLTLEQFIRADSRAAIERKARQRA